MTSPDQFEKQINRLQGINRLWMIFSIAAMVLAIIAFTRSGKVSVDDVIRVKGIIVEDESGNERILIGAPVPFATNRVRTDSARIRDSWGTWMGGDQYMEWYKDYAHHANGIVILDENGWDRIALGDPVPDPIFGKRIGPSTGIIYNDTLGLERSGYGMLDVNGEYRVVLGLDKDDGTEGAALSVLPDGSVGLYLNSDQKSIFMGRSAPEHWENPNGRDFLGIIMEDNDSTRRVIEVAHSE